jgi:peptidylprolyl isomerase
VRKSLALTLSAGLLIALAGCTAAPAAPDCSAAASSGDSSALVTASGEFGSDPEASFPSPLVATSVERSALIEGDGAQVGEGSTVNVSYAAYDGETGQAVGSVQTGLIVVSDSLPGGLLDGLLCTTAGERVAVALPNEQAAEVISGAPGSIVMVFDVVDVYPQAAEGTIQPGRSGFPSVVRAADGRPGISISGEAPDEAKATVLIEGDGDEIAEGDSVLLQSTAVSYSTGDVVSSTWKEGSPALWLMSDDAAATQGSSQPAGITPFLVGEKVGSQVLVVLPGDGDSADATAYVVDVLGILPAA